MLKPKQSDATRTNYMSSDRRENAHRLLTPPRILFTEKCRPPQHRQIPFTIQSRPKGNGVRETGETGSGCNWLTKPLPPSNRVPSPSEARDPRRQAPRPTHGSCRHPGKRRQRETTSVCNKLTNSRSSPLSHDPIAPPVRAARPRPPGVLVPAGARTSESAAGREPMT